MASEERKEGNLKLSHKQWKKLKRKQKRQAAAQQQAGQGQASEGTDEEEEERRRRKVEEENARQNAEWERRDRLAHQLWLEKQEQEEKERLKKEETERKIREEWEERERKEQEEKEKNERDEAERREKQDSLLKKATENEHKEWHNPLAPPNYRNHSSNAEIVRDVSVCPFFTKTGACRFGDRCSRVHLRPDSSTVILMAGMFDNFELRKSNVDDYDTDMNLEYEDKELYRSFREFYHDVVPEFKSVGRVVNVKVCCNHEPHLRGNVYVQYKRESEALDAFVKFNARWYGGRQLTCEFVNIAKWKAAICGLFFVKRCPKGPACNFLHVFRNPGNEFWEADRDFENLSRRSSLGDTPRWQPRSERHGHHHRRSRSGSRSRNRGDSRHRSTRDRSRSRSPVSRSQSRRRSRERQRSSRSPSYRHTSRYRENSSSGKVSSKMKQQRRSRSWSRSPSRGRSRSTSVGRSWSSSRSRSRERESVTGSEPSRCTSKSAEQVEESDGKKQTKSRHKKTKKSSKKKKKDKSRKSPGRGGVSLHHLEDGDSGGDRGREGEGDDNVEDSDTDAVNNDCAMEKEQNGLG